MSLEITSGDLPTSMKSTQTCGPWERRSMISRPSWAKKSNRWMNMITAPSCPKYVSITEGFGFCNRHNLHVYLNPLISPCLCNFCHVDGDGKQYLDPDINILKNEVIKQKKN